MKAVLFEKKKKIEAAVSIRQNTASLTYILALCRNTQSLISTHSLAEPEAHSEPN